MMAQLIDRTMLLEQIRYRTFMAQLTGDCLYETLVQVEFPAALFPAVTGYAALDEGTCSFTALTPTFAELNAQILAVEQQLTSAIGP